MPFHMKTPPDQMVGGRDVSLTLHWNPSMGANWAARFNRAQTMLDQEVLRRTDPYVPLDSGLLKDSALLASSIGEGLLVYSTPSPLRSITTLLPPEPMTHNGAASGSSG